MHDTCVQAICWDSLVKANGTIACPECKCPKLHLGPAVCSKHIGHVLRQSNACTKGCEPTAHPPAEEVLRAVLGWFGEAPRPPAAHWAGHCWAGGDPGGLNGIAWEGYSVVEDEPEASGPGLGLGGTAVVRC